MIRNRNFIVFAALVGLFWVGAAVAPFFVLYEVMAGLVLGVGAAAVVLYAPVGMQVFTVRQPSPGQQLAAGILVTWVGAVLNRTYNLWWRAQGNDAAVADVVNSDFVNFTVFLMIVGGVLHITVPDVETGVVERRSWWLLAVSLVAGGAFAGLIIGIQVGSLWSR